MESKNLIAILDNQYYLVSKIGCGSNSNIYMGYDINDSSKSLMSFKIISDLNCKYDNIINNEFNILSNLNNDYILKIKSKNKGIFYDIINNKQQEIVYLIEELISNYDLLDYIYLTKGFGEEFGKLIFYQILCAVEYIHNNNIYHRDIKVDNIMITNDYKIKLVDFGFSTNCSGYVTDFIGTPNYAAPELHLKLPYLPKYNDIFSLGVTLFVIVNGQLPFKLPLIKDNLYKYFVYNDYLSFWMKKKHLNLSIEFMELFDNLCAFDPTQRPSIEEIKNSKWMKNINWDLYPILIEEFKRRNFIITNNIKNNNL